MGEIKLACSALAWPAGKLVEAIGVISSLGFDGIECSGVLVKEYEDRLHVFEEILEVSNLKLAAMAQAADFLNPETAEEEVERAANTARFLAANGAPALIVSPRNRARKELDSDDFTTIAAILEEMGNRCREFGVELAFRPRSGFVGGSERELKRVLSMADEKVVKLCHDTAELTLADFTAARFFNSFAGRTVYVRLREASGAKRRAAYTQDEPGSAPQFGRGGVDFRKLGKELEKHNYSGWLTLDISGEGKDPEAAVESAFRYVIRKSGLFL